MRNFKDIILEKLKVTTRNSYDDPQVIWDKILTHKFFKRNPRFNLERAFGDELPEVNDSPEIHDDYKGKFMYFEIDEDDNSMRITLDQPDGYFTFMINKVKIFLELFNIEVLEKILEYLDYLEN